MTVGKEVNEMNKQNVKRGLERYGDFLNVTQVAEWLSVDRGTARQYLAGLEYIPNGKEKKYHKDDIAERIMSLRERR